MIRTLCTAILAALLMPSFAIAQEANRFEADIAKFEAMDKETPPPQDAILFLGSSSIRMWNTVVADMAPLPIIHRGFGGSQVTDAIYFADRIVFPYKPRVIVFYEGDNDIGGGKSAETVLADYTRFVELVHSRLPETVIFFVSIKPSKARWNIWPEMNRANMLIDRYSTRHANLAYLDVASAMLNADGEPMDIFLEDDLHMTPEGYKIWTKLIKPRMEANY